MKTGFIAMRLGVVKYIIPFLFVYNPSLLFAGTPQQIGFTIVAGIIGIFILSIGLEGYGLRYLRPLERALFVVGGFLALTPPNRLPYLTLLGMVMSLIVFGWHFRSAKTPAYAQVSAD